LLEMGSLTFIPSLPGTGILSMSTFLVAGITGVSWALHGPHAVRFPHSLSIHLFIG
jgi:hypothetical protein